MNDQKENYYTQAILKYLLQHAMVTTNQLADEIGLSEKTIRTKLASINDLLYANDAGEICKKPRVGVWLNADQNQRLRIEKLVTGSNELDTISSDRERMATALKYVLKANSNILTTKQLADALYLSVPTTLKIIERCRQWLNEYNVEFLIIRNKGFTLRYNEISYRLAIKHFITQFSEFNDIKNLIQFFLPGIQLQEITKIIIETEKEWRFEFAESSFNEVLIYTCLGVYQSQLNKGCHPKINKDELFLLQTYMEYTFATSIFKHISEYFNITIDSNEVAFLSIQILCSKMIDSTQEQDTGLVLRQYDDKLKEFVHKVMSVASSVLEIDLTKDEALYNGLLLHLRPAIFRLNYHRSHENQLTNYIKSEYKHTFRVSWLISVLFEEYFNLQVTEDELSYVVLYIQTALERNEHPLKTLLITNTGMGMNQMLCDKIKRSFPLINEIKVTSYHDYKLEKYKDTDLILTTIDLDNKDKRIVLIDNFLSETSLVNIKKYIRDRLLDTGKKAKFGAECHQLFEPDLIFTQMDFTDKEELLRFLGTELERRGYVSRKYIESVLEREKITPTSIGNGVAIPHGFQEEVYEPKIVIMTLRNKILWDADEVDVIFLLVVKMSTEFEISRTQSFYRQYINLVETDEKVDVLRSFNSGIDFYKYLIQ